MLRALIRYPANMFFENMQRASSRYMEPGMFEETMQGALSRYLEPGMFYETMQGA